MQEQSLFNRYLFLLIGICFLVYPISMGAINSIITLISLIGIFILVNDFRHNRSLVIEVSKSGFLFCFLLMLIPVLLSLINSVEPKETLKVFLNLIRFLPISVICLLMTKNEGQSQKLFYFMIGLILLFLLDAFCELLFGINLRGIKNKDVNFFTIRDLASRVTGLFGDKFHLGYFVATLSPLLFCYIDTCLRSKVIIRIILGILFFILLFLIVLVSGSRAGWLTFIVALLLWGIIFIKQSKFNIKYIVIALIIFLFSIVVLSQIPIVKQRYNAALIEYSGDYTWFDRITSYRTIFWKVALKEVKKTPIVGIGVGGFNEVFQTLPPEEKGYFSVAHHVHLQGLEVLTESGLIGFIAYLILNGYLLYRIFTVNRGREWIMVGFLALMPLNTHMSIYSSFWTPMIWIPIAIGLGQVLGSNKK